VSVGKIEDVKLTKVDVLKAEIVHAIRQHCIRNLQDFPLVAAVEIPVETCLGHAG
jgi:hypothetical protein